MKIIFAVLASMIIFSNVYGQTPAQSINAVAIQAQSNKDEDIQALAKLAARPYGLVGPAADSFPTFIAKSEERFRKGGPGVTEEELVDFHNKIADKLELPQHSRVDKRQMRHLRMSLASVEPNLMGRGLYNPKNRKEVNHTMSPLQAAHLETMMILQKVANPAYQIAPTDWTVEKGKQATRNEIVNQKEKFKTNPKIQELTNAAKVGASKLTASDVYDIFGQIQNTFKITEDK